MVDTDPPVADVLIAGAGLAGLMAARLLRERNLRVLVVEKETHVGGRVSTQQMGEGRADDAAQFFTARTRRFQAILNRWQEEGLIYIWATSWGDGSVAHRTATLHPRYAVQGGMIRLAEHLATGLDIQTGVSLVSVTMAGGGWLALDDKGQTLRGRALLLTPPVPESLRLVDEGDVPLAPEDRNCLKAIHYEPCLGALFLLDGRTKIPDPGAVQRPGSSVVWIADNRRKGISPDATVVTIQASPDYSQELWEASDQRILHALEARLGPYIPTAVRVVEARIRRWLYAMPGPVHPERVLLAEGLLPLAFAGDAFGGPRVEGAVLSGLAAAEALIQRLEADR